MNLVWLMPGLPPLRQLLLLLLLACFYQVTCKHRRPPLRPLCSPSLSTRAISDKSEPRDVVAAWMCGAGWASDVDHHIAVKSLAASLALFISPYLSRSLPSLAQTITSAPRLGHSHHRSPAILFLSLFDPTRLGFRGMVVE